MVPMAPLGHKVQKVTQVIPGRKDHRVKSDRKDYKAKLGLKALQE